MVLLSFFRLQTSDISELKLKKDLHLKRRGGYLVLFSIHKIEYTLKSKNYIDSEREGEGVRDRKEQFCFLISLNKKNKFF